MATASDNRRRVRHIPIAEFRAKVEEHFKINDNKRDDISNTHRLKLIRVLDFLATNFGMTSELILVAVHEFELSLTGLSPAYRDSLLAVFRVICGLAVEWGCLRTNPFDAYAFPERVRREPGGAGLITKLDAGQVRRILDRLKANAGTWDGERLYAFAAMLVFTGVRPGRLVKLEWGQCDLEGGRLLIPRGGRLGSEPHLEPLKIVPELAAILASWKARCPSRSPGQVRGNRLPYGKRWADDGRTLIPEAAEHRVVEEMARWDREGWSYERIARELQSRAIPTKSGLANWRAATVRHILRRKAEEDAHAPPLCPYVFPKHSGKGHWSMYSAPRSTPRHQLGLVGDELGIGRLTPGSLLAFHHANSRTTLDLEVKPARRCPVELGGEGVASKVYGAEVPRLTPDESAIVALFVRAFLDGSEGYTRKELARMTDSATPWRTVAIMRRKPGYEAWREVLPDREHARKGERFGLVDPREGRW